MTQPMLSQSQPASAASQPHARTPILVAETPDVRAFARLLRGIGLKHNAIMTVSPAGFEVTVEEVKSLCATAWIPSNLFSVFEYTPTDEEDEGEAPDCFELSLDALLQCLNIFGNAGGAAGGPSSGRRRWAGDGLPDEDEGPRDRERDRGKNTFMRLTWAGRGSTLDVLLRDDTKGPVTQCRFSTLEPEEIMNHPFDEESQLVYMIMKSPWFRDALLDLPPSAARVILRLKPGEGEQPQRRRPGRFSLYAEGDFGTVQFDYPYERDVMEAFECEQPVVFSYHAAHIALLSKALHGSLKVCLRIDDSGFLSVQVMMPVPESMPPHMHNGILEFKMHALEDDDDE